MGDLTSRTHDQAVSSYAYDARGLLIKETDAQSATDPSPQVTAFSYTPVGQVAGEVKPNGNVVTNSYFADWSLQHSLETKPDGAIVDEHAYTYDQNGNTTQDTETMMSADNSSTDLKRTLTYTYDPRDRVASVANTDGTTTESYVHDANDNVISQTIDGTLTTFNYGRNRLLSSASNEITTNYNYDPFGRLDTVVTNGQLTEQNTYNGFDEITAHKQLNATGSLDTTTYTYDPLGRQTSQTVSPAGGSPTTTNFAYIGLSSQLVSELQKGTQVKSYAYTPGGERISQTTNNSDGTQAPGYFTYNSHSDVEAVTGSGGDTKATYGYTAYGQNNTAQFTGADKNNTAAGKSAQPFNVYRYNSARWDASSGQYDMGFRHYDAPLNQFLTRDMYNGGLLDMSLDTDPFTGNRYTFGSGNPISNIELNGHDSGSGGQLPGGLSGINVGDICSPGGLADYCVVELAVTKEVKTEVQVPNTRTIDVCNPSPNGGIVFPGGGTTPRPPIWTPGGIWTPPGGGILTPGGILIPPGGGIVTPPGGGGIVTPPPPPGCVSKVVEAPGTHAEEQTKRVTAILGVAFNLRSPDTQAFVYAGVAATTSEEEGTEVSVRAGHLVGLSGPATAKQVEDFLAPGATAGFVEYSQGYGRISATRDEHGVMSVETGLGSDPSNDITVGVLQGLIEITPEGQSNPTEPPEGTGGGGGGSFTP